MSGELCACCKAQWIYFELAEDLLDPDNECGGGSSSGSESCAPAECVEATVIDYWQGNDPRASGETTVQLKNSVTPGDKCLFEGIAGERGLACLDDIDDEYRIVTLDKANVRRFQLTENLHGCPDYNDSACAEIFVPGGGSSSLTFTVHDSLGTFRGCVGDRGFARYWPDRGQWEIFYLEEPTEEDASCSCSESESSSSADDSSSSADESSSSVCGYSGSLVVTGDPVQDTDYLTLPRKELVFEDGILCEVNGLTDVEVELCCPDDSSSSDSSLSDSSSSWLDDSSSSSPPV